jgi:hypothetical protein
VKDYEVRLLNRWGRIVRRVPFECADDDTVIGIMSNHAGAFPIEVWDGERLVARFSGTKGAS